jgi:LmbE family N-acetylglucosaminyl deacetylase
MNSPLKLMCILAHPDDESLGMGGTVTRYAAEGVEVHLLTATRGEHGWFGDEASNPGPEALGKLREAELMQAAYVLGISSVSFLDYVDGDLDQAPAEKIIGEIVSQVRRIRPQVVVTFGPDGGYGHPDHIAISQFATAALVRSADSAFIDRTGFPPHAVSKMYYLFLSAGQLSLYQSVFGDLIMHVDGVERRGVPWNEWVMTTSIYTEEYWRVVRDAVACHRTQLRGYDALLSLPEETLRRLWKCNNFYRVFSTVNGGRKLESDLFEGINDRRPTTELLITTDN